MPRPKKSVTKRSQKIKLKPIGPPGKLEVIARSGLRRPRHATVTELKNAGVTLVDEARFWLMCDACGQTWSPNQPLQGQRLHHGYWRCPNGCNADARR